MQEDRERQGKTQKKAQIILISLLALFIRMPSRCVFVICYSHREGSLIKVSDSQLLISSKASVQFL